MLALHAGCLAGAQDKEEVSPQPGLLLRDELTWRSENLSNLVTNPDFKCNVGGLMLAMSTVNGQVAKSGLPEKL